MARTPPSPVIHLDDPRRPSSILRRRLRVRISLKSYAVGPPNRGLTHFWRSARRLPMISKQHRRPIRPLRFWLCPGIRQRRDFHQARKLGASTIADADCERQRHAAHSIANGGGPPHGDAETRQGAAARVALSLLRPDQRTRGDQASSRTWHEQSANSGASLRSPATIGVVARLVTARNCPAHFATASSFPPNPVRLRTSGRISVSPATARARGISPPHLARAYKCKGDGSSDRNTPIYPSSQGGFRVYRPPRNPQITR